jgi:hypothetical protein
MWGNLREDLSLILLLPVTLNRHKRALFVSNDIKILKFYDSAFLLYYFILYYKHVVYICICICICSALLLYYVILYYKHVIYMYMYTYVHIQPPPKTHLQHKQPVR